MNTYYDNIKKKERKEKKFLQTFFSRPDTSFIWLCNPCKTIKYILWRNYKWTILKVFLLVLIIVFLGLLFYNIPGAVVDKMFKTTV